MRITLPGRNICLWDLDQFAGLNSTDFVGFNPQGNYTDLSTVTAGEVSAEFCRVVSATHPYSR
jgi:hypothetical protein